MRSAIAFEVSPARLVPGPALHDLAHVLVADALRHAALRQAERREQIRGAENQRIARRPHQWAVPCGEGASLLTRFMPQIGHLPGPSLTICGCIGHV